MLQSLVGMTFGPAPREEKRSWGAPLRRAKELLRARFTEALSLDEIAAHAGLDKFHLCRAFRDEVGLPPYAYLLHLRIGRAQALLSAGVPPSKVAARVGIYDQSQLNRHFKRILGITPGQYLRAVASSRGPLASSHPRKAV